MGDHAAPTGGSNYMSGAGPAVGGGGDRFQLVGEGGETGLVNVPTTPGITADQIRMRNEGIGQMREMGERYIALGGIDRLLGPLSPLGDIAEGFRSKAEEGEIASLMALMPEGDAGFKGFPSLHPLVTNADGSVSNVKTATVGIDGRTFVIPTMVNGRELSIDEAIGVAEMHGLNKYPSFRNEDDAIRFSESIHGRINEDGSFR